MSIETQDTGISPQVTADAELIAQCVASGKKVPAEVTRRVRGRSEEITERLRRQYGMLDIGVPAIREFRGELPQP